MKNIPFRHFRSSKSQPYQTQAQRLLALKAEIRRLKRRRLIYLATAALFVVTLIVYLLSL
jgi:hypothetical protein